MKRQFIPAVFLLLAGFCLLFVSGCEEKATTPVNVGTPDDEEFEIISDVSDLGLDALKIALDLTDTVMAMGGITKPLFKAHRINDEILTYNSLIYSYNNYWHLFQFSAKMVSTSSGQTDSMIIVGIDSLRFRNSGTYVQYPDDSLTDELDVRQHVSMSAYGADGGTMTVADHANFDVTSESFQGDVINLCGAVNDSVDAVMGDSALQLMTCEMEMTSTQTFNNLILDETQECPTGGSFGLSAAVNINCEGEEGPIAMQSSWTVAYSFNGSTVGIDVYSGNQHWHSVGPCGGE